MFCLFTKYQYNAGLLYSYNLKYFVKFIENSIVLPRRKVNKIV